MPAIRKHPPRGLLLWPLVMTFFLDVSGGPYGLEDLMTSGPGMAILLIVITPIIWAAPAALMTAELASAIPAEGGYYVWVKRCMGPFWSFVCGWWTWLYSWIDVAIYPTLFAGYVSALIKMTGYTSLVGEDHPLNRWLVGLVVIVPFTWLNVRGVKIVGKTALLFALLIIAPFAVILLLGLPHLMSNPGAAIHPFTPPGQTASEAFNAGLFVVMWNYLGWDSLSTVAEEVEQPQKTYPRALAICVPLVVLVYLLPSLVGLVAYPDYKNWASGSWIDVATHVAGPWLGYAVAMIALISAAGLFMATLLGGSRIPFVLAEDGYLPKGITKLHPKYGTPWIAILVSAVFYTLLSFQTFNNLAEQDVVVYSAGIIIEFVALLMLRAKEPNLNRPFKIPGGWPVVILVAVAPIAVVGLAVYNQFAEAESAKDALTAMWVTIVALGSGPIAYLIARWARRRKLNGLTPELPS